MALDGTLLRQIRHELEGVLIGARIDKIHQISREEMIFILRLPQPTADGARSVKRLCVDRKLSLTERDALPALYVGGRLAAVWRLGTDVTFLPKGGNRACFVRVVPR